MYLFLQWRKDQRGIFPAKSCFMRFSWVKKGLVYTLLFSNSSFLGLWLTRSTAAAYTVYWTAAKLCAALTANIQCFVVQQAANACCGWFIPGAKQRYTAKLKGSVANLLQEGVGLFPIREEKPANKSLLPLAATGGAAGPTSAFPEAWH